MLKSILNLEGVQKLGKKEQKNTLGGGRSVCPAPRTQSSCSAAGGFWNGNICLYPINYCNI